MVRSALVCPPGYGGGRGHRAQVPGGGQDAATRSRGPEAHRAVPGRSHPSPGPHRALQEQQPAPAGPRRPQGLPAHPRRDVGKKLVFLY